MKILHFVIFLFATQFPIITFASDTEKCNQTLEIAKIKEKISIDGMLNEESWLTAFPITELWQHYPVDSILANKKTEIRVLIDDEYLYVSAICFDERQNTIVQSLSRDAEAGFWLSDGFSIVIDPLNTGRIGYFFGLNAGGGEIDAFLSQSGFVLLSDIYWSKKWYSSVKQNENAQIYEMAIPLSIMQIDPQNTTWGINFIRNDMENGNTIYEWTKFNSRFDKRDLSKLGTIKLQKKIKNKTTPFSLIPSGTTKFTKNLENKTAATITGKIGLDAKISITPNVSADLMLLPDFTQVNVDRETLSFQDYEQYKAEQRIFFLENSDLFTSYGSSLYKHIYTRRVGINNGTYLPIWAGAKISSSKKGLRWGVINIQTADYEKEPSKNFAIAAINKQFNNKSEIRGLITNIEQFKNGHHQSDTANRTIGIEYKFPAFDGKLNTSITGSKSISKNNPSNSFHWSIATKYMSKHIRQNNLINYAQDNFINQLGYYPRMFKPDDEHHVSIRVGMTEIHNKLEYWHYTNLWNKLNYLVPYLQHNVYVLSNGKLDERWLTIGIQAVQKNSATTLITASYNQEYLLYPFEAIKGIKLFPVGYYSGFSAGINHKTNTRAKISYETDIQYGNYYMGTKTSIYNCLNIRIQPRINIKIDYTKAFVNFPDTYENVNYHLLGAQCDVFFSRNHIWTILYQINTQKDKMKLNTRFQWHYCPMSDLFIVFGEDYTTSTLSAKTINLALKLTYWLSL